MCFVQIPQINSKHWPEGSKDTCCSQRFKTAIVQQGPRQMPSGKLGEMGVSVT